MTYPEHLIQKAQDYWFTRDPLPMDLFTDMLVEGLDVGALETQYHNQQELEESYNNG